MYQSASVGSPVRTKLIKGSLIECVDCEIEADGIRWIPIRSPHGQTGFIRGDVKTSKPFRYRWLNRSRAGLGRGIRIAMEEGRFTLVLAIIVVLLWIGFVGQCIWVETQRTYPGQPQSLYQTSAKELKEQDAELFKSLRRLVGVSGFSLAIPLISHLHRLRKRRRDRLAARCPKCGYDCRATKTSCPECGYDLPWGDLSKTPTPPRPCISKHAHPQQSLHRLFGEI